jgi:hypothetical protein
MLRIINKTGQLQIIGYYKNNGDKKFLLSINKRSSRYLDDKNFERFSDKVNDKIKSGMIEIVEIGKKPIKNSGIAKKPRPSNKKTVDTRVLQPKKEEK